MLIDTLTYTDTGTCTYIYIYIHVHVHVHVLIFFPAIPCNETSSKEARRWRSQGTTEKH